MQFSDAILMAYADGEVDADTRQQIEAAMPLDPVIAERIAEHRRLRTGLGAAFNGVLDEPIPARLLDAANATPDQPAPAPVADLNAVRTAKQRTAKPKRWSWPEWTSLAASLLIGVLAGRAALQPSASSLFATQGSGIVASGELSAALTEQAGGAADTAAVRIGLSFRSRSGEYCRTFTAGSAAGLACREADAWKVRALSEGLPNTPGGEYRMAGSELPPAILAAAGDLMDGAALDADEEREAQARGWKK